MANEQNLTPVQPGQVLNPNGRGKGTLNRSTIARRFLEADSGEKDALGNSLTYGELMTLTLVKKVIKEGDVSAHKEIMDSGYGKIPDKIQSENKVTVNNDLTSKVLSKIPTDELESLLEPDSDHE